MSQVILAQIVGMIADGVNTALEALLVIAVFVFVATMVHVVHVQRTFIRRFR